MGYLLDAYNQLFRQTNKVEGDGKENFEGAVSDLTPELTLSISDEELLDLKRNWENRWKAYESKIQKIQDENERYWLGKQYSDTVLSGDSRPLMDNRIFMAVETFLPIATRQNPEPLVEGDGTEAGEALSDTVKKFLVYHADTQELRLKLKKVVRNWTIYHLGAVKFGWDLIENDIITKVVRSQKLILDPEGTIEEGNYNGEYVGEYRKEKASVLIERFPDHKSDIEAEARGKLGTEIQYMEWWTDDYVFWTLKNIVLGKAKNPHWNYDADLPQLNEFGISSVKKVKGQNHFASPRKPYAFFSVFNLGKQPHDDTGLIQQNLALQDLVNKRTRQIDKNADSANGIWIGSGNYITKAELSKITGRANEKIWLESGNVNEAIKRDTGRSLPDFVYNSLVDYRNEIDNVFGTHGTTRGEQGTQETATGRQILKAGDDSRIGFIADYLEQFTDLIYNWWVQLMMVYYDEPHTARIVGKERSLEYAMLQSSDFIGKLLISVKEGSLVPKDDLVRRNEALELWRASGIDPVTLFDRLEWPNPRESAKQLYLWQNAPQLMFPDIAPQVQQEQLLDAEQQALTSNLGKEEKSAVQK